METALTKGKDGRQGWIRAVCFVILILSSLYIYTMWLIDTRPLMNLNSYERAKFVDMVYGKAHKPFVYRTLVPTLIRTVRQAIPDSVNYDVHGKIYAHFPALYGGMLYLGWELEYLTEYTVAVVLMYGSLLGFMFTLRRLARALYTMDDWLDDALPIIAVWVLPVFFDKGTHYLYDFPQLFFFTLLFYLIIKQNWMVFYPLIFVSFLNKETTLFISLIFALHFAGKMTHKIWNRHLAIQLGLFILVKAFLSLRYVANEGNFVEDHILINFYNALLRPYDLATVLSIIALIVLVGWRFRQKPVALRHGLVVMLPMIVLYITLGTYGEIRVFYELMPIVFLLCVQSLAMFLGWNMCPRASMLVQKVN